MNTFASVIIPAEEQAAAQAELGEGFFTAPLSADGSMPATHFWSSGLFHSTELNTIVNSVAWAKVVGFTDPAAFLAEQGLQPAVESDV